MPISTIVFFFTAVITLLNANSVAFPRDITFIVPDNPDRATRDFIEEFTSAPEFDSVNLNIKQLSYGTLAPTPQTATALLRGLADLALIESWMVPGLTSDASLMMTSLVAQPTVVRSPSEKFQFEDSVVGDVVAIELGQKGFVFLSFWDQVPSSVVTATRQPELANLEGLKIRAPSATSVQVFAELGASPQQIAIGDVNTALQSGAIDGIETIVDNEDNIVLNAAIGGTLLGGFNQRSGYLLAAEDNWINLSEAERHAIELATDRAASIARKTVAAVDESLPKLATANDLQFASFELSDANRDAGLRAWTKNAAGEIEPSIFLVNLTRREIARQSVGRSTTPATTTAAEVYFLTNRNDEGATNLRVRFGIKQNPSEQLSCGKLAFDRHYRRNLGEPYRGPLSLDQSLIKSADACARMILNAAQRFGGRVTLFVHGYNNTFSDSIDRAVAIAQDLSLSEPLVAFSWPSQGKKSGYVFDGHGVDFSRSYIKSVLRALNQLDSAVELTVLAHSMGSRIALDLLEWISDHGQGLPNLVFAAPDVPQPRFMQAIDLYGGASQLVSLYSNEHDRPLLASRYFGKIPPAGLGGEYLLVIDGAETIDASAVDNGLIGKHHSYAFNVKEVINDAGDLINRRLSGAARALVRSQQDGRTYYRIEPN